MGIKIDSGMIDFERENQPGFSLPLVRTNDAMAEIIKSLDATGENHSQNHLKAFQNLVRIEPGVDLSLDECDFVWKHLDMELAKKNELHTASIAAMRKSVSSLVSMRPNGTTNDSSDLPSASHR